MSIKVVIIDPDEDVRRWLGRLLDRTEGFDCTGQYADVEGIFAHPPASRPDLVLVETHLAVSEKEIFKKLKESFGEARFALMDIEEGSSYETISRRMGADIFLSKARVPESLAEMKKLISSSTVVVDRRPSRPDSAKD